MGVKRKRPGGAHRNQLAPEMPRGHYGVRKFDVGRGIASVAALRAELLDMTDVLMGRAQSPFNDRRVDALMEVADAYYARAAEMTMRIQMMEGDGRVRRGDALYKFRTGELRTFMEMAKRASEVGSRRVTVKQMLLESERHGRER